MQLSELLQGIARVSKTRLPELEIAGLGYDSRRVESNFLFVAIKGEKTDGNLFVDQAVKRGAVAVISESSRPTGFVTCWVQVGNARQALATAAANFYGHPTQRIDLIGITGTNGKTSTAYLLEAVLLAAGERVGVVSTIEYRGPGGRIPAVRTTPESLDLQALFADFAGLGCRFVVMEVSSHALAMQRVHACQFRSAVFTNLTQDHMDYHHTLENYFEAKQQLFLGTGLNPPRQSLINRDDSYGARLEEVCAGRCLTYSTCNSADFQVLDSREAKPGLRLRLQTPGGEIELQTRLMGRPNLSNVLASVAVAHDLGIAAEAIKQGIEGCAPIPGRFESVDCGQPFQVFVDYAHTPDALEKLLQTARELPHSRLLVMFGCGGERDRGKRPVMAQIAEGLSDFCWITSDNPRTEDPMKILADVESGFRNQPPRYGVEPDRRKAIRRILREARPGDIVVLAGKGHETYQVLGDRTVHFDDREEACQALHELGAAQ